MGISSIRERLSGYKTYIASAALILEGLRQIVEGQDGFSLILEGIAIMALRGGVEKVVQANTKAPERAPVLAPEVEAAPTETKVD